MEESRSPKAGLNYSQSKREKRKRIDNPGDTGEIYEDGTGYNFQIIA